MMDAIKGGEGARVVYVGLKGKGWRRGRERRMTSCFAVSIRIFFFIKTGFHQSYFSLVPF